jgi:acyl carrier protein
MTPSGPEVTSRTRARPSPSPCDLRGPFPFDRGGAVAHTTPVPTDRADIAARVTALLRRQLPDAADGRRLDESTGLLGQGIGLDSVEVLQLVGAIEEDFDLTIDDESLEAEHFQTVGTVVTFVMGQLGR